MIHRVTAAMAAALATVALCASGPASAQNYPNRPVTMVIPFAPGGASDLVGRMIQPKMSEVLGQNVVVENRAGAGGNIAVDSVARAAPDGYTFLLGNIGTMAINPHIYPNLKTDPLKDLKPVTEIVGVPAVFVVNPKLPVNTVAEFIEYTKKRPGELSFASSGSSSMNRLQMELFRLEAGLDMVHVPYSGGAGPATTAVVAGHVPAGYVTLSSALGHVQEGRLKALAVSTKERLPYLPNVPTMLESGFPSNVSASWQGIQVPAGTPDAIVAKLREAAIAAVTDPETKKRLEATSALIETSETPAAFGDFMKNESDKWKGVIQKTGATPD